MIVWVVAGWLPAVLLWSSSRDLLSTLGGTAWLIVVYWWLWQRSQRERGDT